MFLSALSVKFPGRVMFGALDTDMAEQISVKLGINLVKKLPKYWIVTHDYNVFYGTAPEEFLKYDHMYFYLTTLYPEVNGLFLSSLVLVNLVAALDAFLIRGKPIVHFGNFIWKVGKYNIILIFLWLPLLAIFQLPKMQTICDVCLRFLQFVSSSYVASVVRNVFMFYCEHLLLAVACFIAVGFGGYMFASNSAEEEELAWTWSFPDVPYLFRPVTSSVSRPMRTDIDLEEGIELLIERLAVPNFWLQPIISHDYIRSLPCWVYKHGQRSHKCRLHGGELHENKDDCRAVSKTANFLQTLKHVLLHSSLSKLQNHMPQKISFATNLFKRILRRNKIVESKKACCLGQTISSEGDGVCLLQNQKSSMEIKHKSESNVKEQKHLCASADKDCTVKCCCCSKSLLKHASLHNDIHSESKCVRECVCEENVKPTHLCTSQNERGGVSGIYDKTGQREITSNTDREILSNNSNSDEEQNTNVTETKSQCTCCLNMFPLKDRNHSNCNCNCDGGADLSAPLGVISSADCAICLEFYEAGCLLCALPCGHSFHQHCIVAWLTRDNHCCPVCRWPAYKSKPKIS